jgi:hypothetical protein
MRRTYHYLAAGLIAASTAAGASAHAPAKPRSYAGHTSQGLAMSLKVSRSGRTLSGRLVEGVNCPSLQTGFSGRQSFHSPLPSNRKFAGSYDESGDLPDDPTTGTGDLTYSAHHSIRVKLGVKQAVGTWHTQLTVLDGAGTPVGQCDSGRVSFHLKARR